MKECTRVHLTRITCAICVNWAEIIGILFPFQVDLPPRYQCCTKPLHKMKGRGREIQIERDGERVRDGERERWREREMRGREVRCSHVQGSTSL